MIGNGRFAAYLSTVEGVLKEVDLFDERNAWPNKSLGAAHFKRLSYRQVYEECVKESAYDFQLKDQSLLLFVKGSQDEPDSLSYCYYESPAAVMSYEEFVEVQLGLTPLDAQYQEAVLTVGEEWRPDYEQYVVNTESKRHVTPIRYDYKATNYREGVHPASHMHFGFANEIRVGTRRILNPVSFLLLILRQRYPHAWKVVLRHRKAKYWCRNVRERISEVDTVYWRALDQQEMAFH